LQYQKSLTLKRKACIAKSNTAAHTKKCKSLLPKKKAHVLAIDATEHIKHRKSLSKQIADQIKRYADTLTTAIDLNQAAIEFLRVHFYKHLSLALICFHCCLIDPRSAIFNDELGLTKDNTAMWNCISKLIGSPIGQNEIVLCQQTFQDLNQSHAKISACASCCER
jgi:hypothetical protein